MKRSRSGEKADLGRRQHLGAPGEPHRLVGHGARSRARTPTHSARSASASSVSEQRAALSHDSSIAATIARALAAALRAFCRVAGGVLACPLHRSMRKTRSAGRGGHARCSAAAAPRRPPTCSSARGRPRRGQAAGLEREAVLEKGAAGLRINDVAACALARLTAQPPALHGRHPARARGSSALVGDRPALPRPARRRVRGEGAAGRPRGRRLDAARRPARARRAPRAGCRVDVDLARYAGQGRELVLETRGYEETRRARRRPSGARRRSRRRTRRRRSRSSTSWTRCAPTTPALYGYARDTTPELDAFAKDAVVFERRSRTRRGPSPSVASIFTSLPARPAPRGAAARPARPRPRDAGRDAAGEGLRDRRRDRQLGDLRRGLELRAGLRLLRRPARRRRHGRRSWWSADVRGGRGARVPATRGAGFPTFLYVHTMDPHVPYAPPAPFDRKYEPHPTPGAPGARPAQRLQGAARPRAA